VQKNSMNPFLFGAKSGVENLRRFPIALKVRVQRSRFATVAKDDLRDERVGGEGDIGASEFG
jgi:hypothetical protein